MGDGMSAAPMIFVLSQGALATARRLQQAVPGATILGLAGRVVGADVAYEHFGSAVRDAYVRDIPIVALCAAGIVIRAVSGLLQDKRAEPPVLAVGEDGSSVVPLLGGLRGVNDLARTLAAALDVAPAITTSGELRFSSALENPPPGYVLRNPDAGKKFMSDLLAGASARLVGEAPWLSGSKIPFADDGALTATITPLERAPAPDELIYHPRVLALGLAAGGGEAADLAVAANALLTGPGYARAALAWVGAPARDVADPAVLAAAAALGVPLRLVPDATDAATAVRAAVPDGSVTLSSCGGAALAVAANPDALRTDAGRPRGVLTVVGIGPGAPELCVPAVKEALRQAQDLVGYETYVRMAGPFRPDQTLHLSDNRVELERARHAFELAATGRRVAVVSSGDPGVFAMAAAVLEALEAPLDPAWRGVDLTILPGVSAAQAAASLAGAPLGHDFCVISLSDNLKPWDVVLARLEAAARADLVIALYNPISKARPWQLGAALERLRALRAPETPVVLGRDVGRPAQSLRVVPLGDLRAEMADMRTVLILGSSLTRAFPRADGGTWVYAPRWVR